MILIFGGTTEGRMAVEVVDDTGSPYYYSTKESHQAIECRNGNRLTGAMDAGTMVSFCRKHDIRLLIDAAHPFAGQLHATVAHAAQELSLPVIRIERHYPPRDNDIIWCDSYEDAIKRLKRDGITFLLALTGVQTIEKLKPYSSGNKCIFRILKQEASINLAHQMGVKDENIVFYQKGDELNLLQHTSPQAILTKESGMSGGFEAKVNAARQLRIPIYAIKRPLMPQGFITITGKFGLRKQIEHFIPGFFPLRSGYTTGSCATAAAKAALLALLTQQKQNHVTFSLPDDEEMTLAIAETIVNEHFATATVIKDAGDDPDVTNGCHICAKVSFNNSGEIRFLQGNGVGVVTLPGLGLDIGSPAINKVPRQMIINELSSLHIGGLDVTISVPGGETIAEKTFNPKLGIAGGISIIGTSGIVMPFSAEAFIKAIRKEIEVCKAVCPNLLVINSGAKSERYIRTHYPKLPPQAFVHYGNFIGETLKIATELEIPSVTMGIMIGKAVKLAEGQFNTHSKNVQMNKIFLKEVAHQAGCSIKTAETIDKITLARELWDELPHQDLQPFMKALLNNCHRYCTSLLPKSRFEILLIREDGTILSSIQAQKSHGRGNTSKPISSSG